MPGMKVYKRGARRCWYDSHIRSWTLQTVDASESQVGNVAYEAGPQGRQRALAWLNFEDRQERDYLLYLLRQVEALRNGKKIQVQS